MIVYRDEMIDEEAAAAIADDVVLLLQACTATFGDRVLERVREEAGESVRFNDGYVFQHLVPGPIAISVLARRLGVTQQAASKQVLDLEGRDLVRRRADPADGRGTLVELSRRGRRAVEAGRTARRELADEITAVLGPRRAAALVRALADVSAHTGAVERMAARRLRPESDR